MGIPLTWWPRSASSPSCSAPTSPMVNAVISFLAIALTCGAIIRALDIDRMVGLILYTEQYLSIILCLALPLVYLAVPAGKGRRREGKVPWYDVIAALLGFVVAVYVAIRFPVLAELTTVRPFDGIIVTCAPDRVPDPLLGQLKEGGRLVLPVGSYSQELRRITRHSGGFESEDVIPVIFVPMTGEAEKKR